MNFSEKKIVLKSGEECVLVSPTSKDAVAILDHLRKTSDETNYMVRYGEEIVMGEQQECAFLEKTLQSPTDLMICAKINGKLVANAGISQISPQIKMKHRAEFGISIQEEYWNKGIGSAIINEIITQAKHAGFEQLELDVVSENERAHHVYQKYGFKDCGVLPHAFRLKDGTYYDFIVMYLDLRDAK